MAHTLVIRPTYSGYAQNWRHSGRCGSVWNNNIFGGNITMDPMVALLGLLPRGIEWRAKKYLLQILLATAIKCITGCITDWSLAQHNMWTEKIKGIYQMEQITYSLRLQKHIFTKGEKLI